MCDTWMDWKEEFIWWNFHVFLLFSALDVLFYSKNVTTMLIWEQSKQFSTLVDFVDFVCVLICHSVISLCNKESPHSSLSRAEANFQEMELGGIILISTGFFLVMFPNNWPDYITRLLRFVVPMLSVYSHSIQTFCLCVSMKCSSEIRFFVFS